MNYTENYHLGLPLPAEKYDVTIFNSNNSVIDGQMKSNSDAITNHTSNVSNPHHVTASQVGLGNVDNTSDMAKPVSNLQAQAIAQAVGAIPEATTSVNGLMTASMVQKLNGIESGAQVNTITGVKGNAETDYRTGNVNITASNIGLGDVGNFKAVSTVANQGLTDTEKANARTNIGAGDSSFSGDYNDLTNKPTIPSKTSELTNDSGFTTNSGTVTSIATGNGLKGGTITSSGTIQFDVPRITENANQSPGSNTWTFKEFAAGDSYNLPTNAWYYIITAEGGDPNFEVQLALGETTTAVYYRSKQSNSWTAWYPLVNPAVYNGTLTIQRNGSNVQTFTANQSSNVTANISVDSWTSTATVSSNNTVTFSGLNDSYGYDLYCQNKFISVTGISKSGGGASTTLTYTVSGATTGDVCKLRILL